MKKYSYEQIDEHLQWLMKMMDEEYPNNYELILNSTGAEIRSTISTLTFIQDKYKPATILTNIDNKDGNKNINLKERLSYTE